MHEKIAHFGSNRFCVFRVPLHGEIEHGHLVFVLQQTKHDEGTRHARCIDFRWCVFQIHGDAHSRLPRALSISMTRVKQTKNSAHLGLGFLLRGPPPHVPFRPLEILKLEYPGIIPRQVLKRIPRTRAERSQASESLEAHTRGNVLRRRHLVGKRRVFFRLACSRLPLLKSDKRSSSR